MFLKVEVKFLKAERLQERYEELLHAFHPDPQFLIFCDMFFFPFFSSLHYIHTHTHTHTHTPLLNRGELAIDINKNLLLYNNILFKITEFNIDTKQ